MSMHFGAPCTPTVSRATMSNLDRRSANSKSRRSIHASVSGTVAAVEPSYSMGGKVMSVVIDNDFPKDSERGESMLRPTPTRASVEEMVEMRSKAGRYRPVWAAQRSPHEISSGIGKVDTVIINGAECRPTSPATTIAAILKRPLKIIGCCYHKMFGVEARSSSAWRTTRKNGIGPSTRSSPSRRLLSWSNRWLSLPLWAVKQLSGAAITASRCPGRSSREHRLRRVQHQHHHRLPCHQDGMPVVRKVVTVSGSGVVEPKNLECPIGTPVPPVRRLRRPEGRRSSSSPAAR